MNSIRQEKTVVFADNSEYQSVKRILGSDPNFASTKRLIQTFDDAGISITYLTEEITPEYEGNYRTKVLLLFKNPHPDSVAAGLFLSERYSKAFWERLFEVDCNLKLLPLLKRLDWITNLADILLAGKYAPPFLYYFRCLYPFPTRQFPDLQKLFVGAPITYRKEILDKSPEELVAYIERNDIKNVIVFFKEGMERLNGIPLVKADDIIKDIKRWIDQYLCHNDPSLFWNKYISRGVLKQSLSNGINIYFNMHTRAKNHGDHLPKRYFTYNLEFILKDILKNSPAQNHQ